MIPFNFNTASRLMGSVLSKYLNTGGTDSIPYTVDNNTATAGADAIDARLLDRLVDQARFSGCS